MLMRKEKKLTQTELGTLLGVSYMTIRRWETGKSKPNIDKINELANIFGTSVEYLLDLQDKNTALELTDKTLNEDIELKEPISAGMTDNMIIIKDWNTQQTYYFPNNEEGRRFFTDFTTHLFHLRTPTVSGNTINGDNNSNNNLGIIQK